MLATENSQLIGATATDRLSQVVENLVDNALGFAPPDGTISVELTADGRRARLSVEDEGPGIPPEHLERVFDRFFSYRPDEADSRLRHTGLGLAIVRTIVESHGGRVSAGNGSAGGARLLVELPRARAGSAKPAR